MLRLLKSLSNGVELSRLLRPENYLIFIPILTITSAFTNAGVSDPVLLVTWVVANLVAFALLFLMMLAFAELLRRSARRSILRPFGLLLFGTALGAVKNLITFLAFSLIQPQSFGVWILERTAANLPMGITVIGIVALMLVAKDNYLAERELLLSQRIARGGSVESATTRIRSSLVEQAAREISRVRRRLDQAKDDAKLLTQAQDLRDLAEFTLRPLSHRIWSQQSVKLNDFSLKQLIRLGVSEKPFVPVLFVLFFVPGVFSWAQAQHGPLLAGQMILQIALMLVLMQYSVNWLRLKSAAAGWLRLISVSVLGGLGSTLVLYPGETFVSETQMWAMLFSLSTWFLALSIMISILSAGFRARADLRSELEGLYGKEALQRILDGSISIYESRRVAQALHSDVQNRLISAALQLEQGKFATKQQLSAELSAIEAIVLELGRGEPAGKHSAKAEIAKAADAWRGFLDVELAVEGDISGWDSISGELGQLVSEALSNAKRHGRATRVKMRISAGNGQLQFSIRDDGSGPQDTKPGLGFALFESLSPAGFKLAGDSAGSELSIEVPQPRAWAIGSPSQ